MSYTYHSEKYRNARNTATIIVEKRADKYPWGWGIPLWYVYLKCDGCDVAQRIKQSLKNKPSSKTIQELIQSL